MLNSLIFIFVEKVQNGGTHTLHLVKYPDNLTQKGKQQDNHLLLAYCAAKCDRFQTF